MINHFHHSPVAIDWKKTGIKIKKNRERNKGRNKQRKREKEREREREAMYRVRDICCYQFI